ncbi:hypothetical protein [Peribacillus muralis]
MKVTVVKGPLFDQVEKEVYKKLYQVILKNAKDKTPDATKVSA